MLMATPAAFSGASHSSLVNCEPWSVLKISGASSNLPLRDGACAVG